MDTVDITQVRELRLHPEMQNWSSKLQNACVTFWSSLPASTDIEQSKIDLFTELLQMPHALELAQLVIVELRTGSDPLSQALAPSKLKIIHALQPALREQVWPQPAQFQERIDTATYRAEKHAFYDADIHRVKLFLRRTENFTVEEELALIKWLEECPVKPKAMQAVNNTENQGAREEREREAEEAGHSASTLR